MKPRGDFMVPALSTHVLACLIPIIRLQNRPGSSFSPHHCQERKFWYANMWDRITSFIKSRSKKASCQAQRTDNGLEQSQNILEVPPSIALDHLTAQLESVEQPSDL